MQLRITESFKYDHIKQAIYDYSVIVGEKYIAPPQNNPSQNITLDIETNFKGLNDTTMVRTWWDSWWSSVSTQDYILTNQNYILGNPIVRITVKKLKSVKNYHKRTKEAIPVYISGDEFAYTDSLGDNADNSEIELSNNLGSINFTDSGDDLAAYRAGGYVMFYPRNSSEIIKYLEESTLLSPNWIHIIIQIVVFNRNTDMMSLNEIVFTKMASGEIRPEVYLVSTLDYYSSTIDYFRAALEVIFLIIFSRRLYSLIFFIGKNFLKNASPHYSKQSENFKTANT